MTSRSEVSVSVVMGVFGGAERFRETIESVLDEDMENFEFIIVDDGSVHEDVDLVLDQYVSRDARVRLVRTDHGGLTKALMKGCDLSKGRYIARIDAGDMMAPRRLAAQAKVLDAYPDCTLVSSWAKFHGPNWEPLWTNRGAPATREPVSVVGDDPGQGLQADVPHHGTVMFRASAYRQVGGYRAEFYYGQDWDLWYRLAEHGTFMVVQDALYHARLFPDSISLKNAEHQRAVAECSLGAYAARRRGESERAWVDRASRIRPRLNGVPATTSGARDCEPGYYFIGEALRRNRDRRCRHYLMKAMRQAPWRPRAYVRLVQSLLRVGDSA